MLQTLLSTWLILASLIPARPSAQSATGTYVQLDKVDSSYLWSGGNLKARFPYWNGYGTSMGAAFRLDSMVRSSGDLRFCIKAGHSYGDYGWTDFNECVETAPVKSRKPQFLPPDSSRMVWFEESSSELLVRTAKGDSLRFHREDRGDTLVVSWWWFYLRRPENGEAVHLVASGNYDRDLARSLMGYLVRLHRMDTANAGERHSVLRVVQRFVPEGTVTLRPQKRPYVPVAGARERDALGRKHLPYVEKSGQILSSPFTTPVFLP